MKTFDPSSITLSAFVPLDGIVPKPAKTPFVYHERADVLLEGTQIDESFFQQLISVEAEFWVCFSLRFARENGYIASNACYTECEIVEDADEGFFIHARNPSKDCGLPQEVRVPLEVVDGLYYCDLTELTEKADHLYKDI